MGDIIDFSKFKDKKTITKSIETAVKSATETGILPTKNKTIEVHEFVDHLQKLGWYTDIKFVVSNPYTILLYMDSTLVHKIEVYPESKFLDVTIGNPDITTSLLNPLVHTINSCLQHNYPHIAIFGVIRV